MTITSNAPIDAANIQNFLGAGARGFVKNCRFLVVITPPRTMLSSVQGLHFGQLMRDLSFLCEAAEVAGRAMQTVDARYNGPSFKLPYQSVFNDMNLTFLCRTEMREKRFFDYWQNKVNPNSTFDFDYLDNYASTINLYTFDEGGHAAYQQTLMKAWPVSVNPIQTTWADDQIARLTVTFTYKYYATAEDPPPVPVLSSLVSGSTSDFNGVPFLGTNF